MAFDIFGERLTPGYCEVHPSGPEEYPCWLCIDAARAAGVARRASARALDAAMALAHIESSAEQSDPGVI